MTTAEKRDASLHNANTTRLELSLTRRSLRSGALTLDAVMTDPPDVLRNVPLIDVIRWTRTQGRRRAVAFTVIGQRAVQDNVNLMRPLGEASARSRAWVAEHGTYLGRHGA